MKNYNIGTKVYHTTKKKWGKVVLVGPKESNTLYHVNHSGYTWAVRAKFLSTKKD